ncbi:CaiB/BaiF CoA transferase family protein [Pseudonocardia halophobica]|uniref:CaiB/BaiF CoA transferase family protein n=1 Tax=Pseudonocardia halophobica TaxID=29401 RepID=UPI003D8D173E
MPFAPLTGVRVVDFTWNVAGPTATKVLAALGADVVKVEYPTRPDPGRVFSFSPVVPGVYDSGGFFADLNIGKRSLTVDPRQPAGLALVEELIGAADVLVESYSPRVMAGWGLTFDRMRELNDRIVYLSISGFGHSGPHGSYVSYGPTAQAASGVTYASGEPGRPPAGWGYSFLDVMTGYQAAYAVTVALAPTEREATRIDLSQVETGAAMLAPLLLDAAVNGTDTTTGAFPPGNRSAWPDGTVDGYRYERGAPYGVYRTADEGTDGFCAITVLDDDQWAALRECLGDPEWARDPRYATVAGRVADQDSLDAHLSEWTRTQTKYELMARLQSAGVPAGAVQSGRDRLEHDPSLRAREVFQRRTHAWVGEHRFGSLPVHVDGEPLPLADRWPLLGADTDAVLAEWLEADPARCAELREAGVTWPDGLPLPSYYPQAV